MAKIIVRFKIYSDNNDIKILDEIISIKPDIKYIKGEPVILTDGTDTGRKRKESNYSYNFTMDDVGSVEECINKWLSIWDKYHIHLEKLKLQGFTLQLFFETVIYDLKSPEFYISNELLKKLGNYGIELAFDLFFD